MPQFIPIIITAIQSGWAAVTAAQIATAIVATAVQYAQMQQANRKMPAPAKQASVLQVRMGETPRRAILGKAWTGGDFMYGFNFDEGDEQNEWEAIFIKFADHPIQNFEGFLVNDTYYTFAGDGAQPSFSLNGKDYLKMFFLDGSPGQSVPTLVLDKNSGEWTADDKATGCSGVWIFYRENQGVWPSGRPQFRFYLGGARVYDPRHDSTVEGGDPAGLQRIDDPSTWTYSENVVVLGLNYRLGIYNGTELMVGRGLTLDAALGASGAALAEYMEAANICDEPVELLAGGTQTRYQGGFVIDADEAYDEVLQRIADACAGIVVPRSGRLAILPGAAQTPHAGFTDLDLVPGEPIHFSRFLPIPERVNTVVSEFPSLDTYGNMTSVTRRVFADLIEDGTANHPKPHELKHPLLGVFDQVRAQRIAEVKRRECRLERRASVMLPPRFANVEVGDWIPWTSDRYLDGETVMFRVVKEERQISQAKRVSLREISSTAYDWLKEYEDPNNTENPASGAPTARYLIWDDGDAMAWDGAERSKWDN